MGNYIYLDLKDEFNHKIIATGDILKSKTSLTNLGISGECMPEFFEPGFLPDSLEIVNIEGSSFRFPDKSQVQYDNITCQEQVIPIPQGTYSKVHFVGLCEWGDFEEKVKLNFTDGEKEEAKISIYEWRRGDLLFNCEVPRNCKVALKAKDSVGSWKFIYSCSDEIKNNDKVLSSLQLPYNLCIHILAITLET